MNLADEKRHYQQPTTESRRYDDVKARSSTAASRIERATEDLMATFRTCRNDDADFEAFVAPAARSR